MKKMVIDGAYIYSGKSFSHTAVKKIRDGGIIELGYSSWEDDEQWIEVLEDNFFIGFINSKTKLVDLDNYCYVIQDNLFCYEKPDFSSGITICLKRYDRIYLISKLFNKGQLWLKIYDKHGFCCYIEENSCIFPNKLIPYSATLAESTIMYVTSAKKDIYRPIRLKKRSRVYVRGLIAYRPRTGLETNFHPLLNDNNPGLIYNNKNSDYLFAEDRINYLLGSNFMDNPGYACDIWLEIYARGLTGYIPAITKIHSIPYIDRLPTEHSIPNSGFQDFIDRNITAIPGLISIVLGTIIFLIVPTLLIFAVYLWILGICLITLKIFCS